MALIKNGKKVQLGTGYGPPSIPYAEYRNQQQQERAASVSAMERAARTLLEKLRDAFRTLIDKLTGAERRRAQTAEGKLTAALEAAARQPGYGTQNAGSAEGGEERFSIKQTSQMTLAEQLKRFYDGKMASSDAFYFGITPETLSAAGIDAYPLAFTISDFKKSTQRRHDIPHRVLKNMYLLGLVFDNIVAHIQPPCQAMNDRPADRVPVCITDNHCQRISKGDARLQRCF